MFNFNKGQGQKSVVDAAKIENLLNRRVEKIFPSTEFLRDRLMSGERMTLYLGIDPTGPTLHIGHAVNLMKLREFQELGHQVILLIGDFTGMIGDPTDKSATRKQLTRDEVLRNAKLYKQQASKFLKFTGSNKAQIKYNSKWLSKMTFKDVIKLASLVTVDQMLKRDMFARRMEAGQPIHIHEFMYPLMQGYDSVAMKVDGELGGNDQTFNMLSGRDLAKAINGTNKFVLASKLLADPSGKKMGKTEGNMISLDMTAADMFGRVMSWSDPMVIPAFELCTTISTEEIESLKLALSNGENPKNIKMRLAREISALYHGIDAANKAESDFNSAFSGGNFTSLAKEVVVPQGSELSGVLVEQGIVDSKSDFRRLIDEGAITVIDPIIASDDQNKFSKILDPHYKITANVDIKIGKKRFVRIISQ